MSSNHLKNGLHRPWVEHEKKWVEHEVHEKKIEEEMDLEVNVGIEIVEGEESKDQREQRLKKPWNTNLQIDYSRVDVKCEDPEDNGGFRPSSSSSPTTASSNTINANDAEEEQDNSIRKLTNLVDKTMPGLLSTENLNSMDSGSSSSETCFSPTLPVEDDLRSPRSAFVPACLRYPPTYAYPGISYHGVSCHHLNTTESIQIRQDLMARQEHAAFDRFAIQQRQLALEAATRMINHHEVLAKQNKKLRPKKFQCPSCDIAFSNNGQLKGHIRIHTGERPFKCDEEGCGKTFTRNEELTRHKRIHSGVRPHACPICGKCFGRKDHLKKHTRTHEMRGPAIYIPPPVPLSFTSLNPYLFGL